MFLLLQVINLFDQLYVLLHEPFVHLFVGLVGFSQCSSQMVHILLQILAQLLELEGCIGIILPLGLDLFSHVHLVQTNNRLL